MRGYEYTRHAVVILTESKISGLSSNFNRGHCVHFRTNTLGKSRIHPIFVCVSRLLIVEQMELSSLGWQLV